MPLRLSRPRSSASAVVQETRQERHSVGPQPRRLSIDVQTCPMMSGVAWEWIGPTGSAVVGFVGAVGAVTGIYFTYRTGERSRQHTLAIAEAKNALDLRLASEKHEHEVMVVQQEREQQRRVEAYIEVLTKVEKLGYWASRIHPLKASEHEDVPNDSILRGDARNSALLLAYGSDEVRELYNMWCRCITEVKDAIELIRMDHEAKEIGQMNEVWSRLMERLRPDEENARSSLATRIAEELGGSRSGTAVHQSAKHDVKSV
jgi:hypothetical protein